ncbi:MAG: hypothetical protein LBU80_00575 [Rikenellaceae bacterium]|jgi:hypothetical protein|nr:hypothetical protein [Rikenellaceae bacterium]
MKAKTLTPAAMKRISVLFCAGVLMSALCTAFVDCNDEPKEPGQRQEGSKGEEQSGEQKEEPTEVGITPVPTSEIPEEVAAFFEKNPMIFDDFFNKIDYSYDIPLPCFTINSMKELREYAPSATVLPEIDFGKYTLVITRYYTTGGLYLKSHAIDTEPDVMNLNFVFGDTGKGLAAMFPQIYCEFYPKLPQKTIEIKSTTVKEY